MSLIARLITAAAMVLSLASCGGGGGGGGHSTPVTTSTPTGTTGTGTSTGTGTGSGTGTGTGAGTPTSTNAPTVSLASQTGANVTPVSVNAGTSSEFPNLILVSVTVCSSTNTSTCVTIPNIQVDTGSVGLRVLDSAVHSLNLAPVTNTGGALVGECAQFADGSSWGAVRYANVTIGGVTTGGSAPGSGGVIVGGVTTGGLTTSTIPVQVIDDGVDAADQVATPEPSACSSDGTAENTAATLGANGILGVGYFLQDCGVDCAPSMTQNNTNNGFYFNCTGNSCSEATANTNLQVSNPISAFPSPYNNGNVIELPAVPDGGAMVANGYLIFGVSATGSGANNALPAGTPIGVDGIGDLSVTFNNTTYATSFIDSGSSVYFFNDSAITQCGNSSNAPGFYCPATEFTSQTTTITDNTMGILNYPGTVSFTFNIGNAVNLFDSTTSANAFAFNNLGAPQGSISIPTTSFDVGEPFFYGRSIFTVIEGQIVVGTPTYTGPFAAVGTAPT